MQRVTGTFNGTGAALYILCGFEPDEVVVRAVGDAGAESPSVVWNRNMRVAAHGEGVVDTDGQTTLVQKAAGTAIQTYAGGEVLTAAMQTSVTYGEGIYLVRDVKDYRAPQPDGDAVADAITSWTLGSSANRTGNFNEDVVGTSIGAGSRIVIASPNDAKRYEAYIEVLTAAQGEAANEVTLSKSIPSGDVRFISGMYDYAPLAVGELTPAGFKLSLTALVNVNDEMQEFVATKW